MSEGSNSPRSIGSNSNSNSQIRSEKKQPKSAIKDDHHPPTASFRQTLVKDASTSNLKHDNQSKNDITTGTESKIHTQIPISTQPSSGAPSSSKSTRISAGEIPPAVSPILASSLGLNRIKTRSGPLPQESYLGFNNANTKTSSIGASNLSKGKNSTGGDGGSFKRTVFENGDRSAWADNVSSPSRDQTPHVIGRSPLPGEGKSPNLKEEVIVKEPSDNNTIQKVACEVDLNNIKPNITDESSIICEEEVPTLHVEEHSRVCAIADPCDQTGLRVDERLVRVAETLEKLMESISQSPDGVNKVSNEDCDIVSPRLSDLSPRGSKGMLDCLPESDHSVSLEDLKISKHSSGKDRTSIDDFEIIKPIRRVAFGRAFLAKKRTTGDLFAIKVLKKADVIGKNAVESILAERDILISVRNPFVVRFFYSFTCRENLYLVMEYLNGGDLYSLLRNLGCLNEDVARIYIAQVVLALEYLHSQRVVHGNLKPDNLFIAHDGHIKLTDFGVSKVGLINNSTDDLCGLAVRCKNRSAVGTPDYLAPEVLLGTGHGTSTDWWSVGVILFELIVGIPPFNADHPQMIFDNILNRNIPWPAVPDKMSLEAHDLIDQLLREDPNQRLGARGASEVKQHPYFRDINWDTLAIQKAAFIPSSEQVYGETDNSSDDADVDFGGLTEIESGDAVNYSFRNFSYKNVSQLASINYDLLSKEKEVI